MAETTSSIQQQPNWLDLIPTEILEIILKKLHSSVGNIVRFKAVCRSWYKAANSYTSSPLYSHLSQTTPWMMLHLKDHDNDEDTNSYCFFSVEENKTYKFNKNKYLKKGCGKYYNVVGCSHGWLVIYDKITLHLTLFNPCSNVEVFLPSVKNLFLHAEDHAIYNYKAILSSDPSRTKNWSIVVSNRKGLAFYTHGNTTSTSTSTTWTEFGYLPVRYDSYMDILWHNDKLYALVYGGSVSVEVWEFENSTTTFPFKVASLKNTHHFDKHPDVIVPTIKYYYLVESLDHVLIVLQALDITYIPSMKRIHFYVYKLDYDGKKWDNVESLGDGILFLSSCQSTKSIWAGNSSKLFQENSIYFIDYMRWFGGCPKVGVYKLEEKVLKPCFYPPIVNKPLFWIVPNPMPAS